MTRLRRRRRQVAWALTPAALRPAPELVVCSSDKGAWWILNDDVMLLQAVPTQELSAMQAQTAPVHRALIRFHGLDSSGSALIVAVENNSPAQRAGLLTGDLIVAIAGRSVDGVDALHRVLSEENARLDSITIIRGTEKRTVAIRPEDRPGED